MKNNLTRLNNAIAAITAYGASHQNSRDNANWVAARLTAWLGNNANAAEHQAVSLLMSQNNGHNRPGLFTRHAKRLRELRRAEILIEAVLLHEIHNVAKGRIERVAYASLDNEMHALLGDTRRQASPFVADVAKADLTTHRPLKIGISVGNHPDGGPGTITCFVLCNATNATMLLTNFHVAANSYPNGGVPLATGNHVIGLAQLPGAQPHIIQKAGLNGGLYPAHKVADYTRGMLRGAPIGIDAAVCTLTNGIQAVNSTPEGVAILNLPIAPAVGMAVWKRGAASGIQHGTITAIGHAGATQYNPKFGGNLVMAGSIQVTGNTQQFQIPGDSGSLLIDSATGRPVGQLHGGGAQIGLATPIGDVLQALNVTIL